MNVHRVHPHALRDSKEPSPSPKPGTALEQVRSISSGSPVGEESAAQRPSHSPSAASTPTPGAPMAMNAPSQGADIHQEQRAGRDGETAAGAAEDAKATHAETENAPGEQEGAAEDAKATHAEEENAPGEQEFLRSYPDFQSGFQSFIPTDFAQGLADTDQHKQSRTRKRSRGGSFRLHMNKGLSRGLSLLPMEQGEDAHHNTDMLHAELAALAPIELEADSEAMTDVMDRLFDLSDRILPHMLQSQLAEMMVIPYEAWKSAKHIPRSSENLTRPIRKSDFGSIDDDLVVFITHRWWNPAQNHPDDEDGSKYDIISRALEELIETSGVDLETTNVVIWIDYACIDQDDRELQSRGIGSLISYAARADVVITPVQLEPNAIEAFSSATHPTDLENYGERAWCRLETYMFMCVGEMLMRPIYLFGYGMAASPGGAVTCNCFSKPKVEPPEWTLKRLTAVGEEAIDMIEQQIRNNKDNQSRDTANSSRHSLVLSKKMSMRLSKRSNSETWDAGNVGIEFAESQLPSHGELTVESDRKVIRSIEQNLMNSYVHFAILYQCTMIRCALQKNAELAGISAEDAQAFVKKKRVTFSLRGKQVRSKDLVMLQTHLDVAPFVSQIQTLDLSHNLLDKTHIKEFFAHVTDLQSCLEVLRLDGNPLLGGEGVAELRDFIESSTSLIALTLTHCAMDNRGMREICKFEFPKSFQELDVSYNMLGGRYIERWMDNNKGKAIGFSGTNMSPERMSSLVLKQGNAGSFFSPIRTFESPGHRKKKGTEK